MRVLSVDAYTINNILEFLKKIPTFYDLELMIKNTPAGTIYLLFQDGKALTNCWMDTLATYRFMTHLWLNHHKKALQIADNNCGWS